MRCCLNCGCITSYIGMYDSRTRPKQWTDWPQHVCHLLLNKIKEIFQKFIDEKNISTLFPKLTIQNLRTFSSKQIGCLPAISFKDADGKNNAHYHHFFSMIKDLQKNIKSSKGDDPDQLVQNKLLKSLSNDQLEILIDDIMNKTTHHKKEIEECSDSFVEDVLNELINRWQSSPCPQIQKMIIKNFKFNPPFFIDKLSSSGDKVITFLGPLNQEELLELISNVYIHPPKNKTSVFTKTLVHQYFKMGDLTQRTVDLMNALKIAKDVSILTEEHLEMFAEYLDFETVYNLVERLKSHSHSMLTLHPCHRYLFAHLSKYSTKYEELFTQKFQALDFSSEFCEREFESYMCVFWPSSSHDENSDFLNGRQVIINALQKQTKQWFLKFYSNPFSTPLTLSDTTERFLFPLLTYSEIQKTNIKLTIRQIGRLKPVEAQAYVQNLSNEDIHHLISQFLKFKRVDNREKIKAMEILFSEAEKRIIQNKSKAYDDLLPALSKKCNDYESYILNFSPLIAALKPPASSS